VTALAVAFRCVDVYLVFQDSPCHVLGIMPDILLTALSLYARVFMPFTLMHISHAMSKF
jgi:hypothetical protein